MEERGKGSERDRNGLVTATRVGRAEKAGSHFFVFLLFSLLLRMEFQYQLLNTVRATVLKLCMTANIHLGCDAMRSAVNIRNSLLCNLRTIVPVYTASYTTTNLVIFSYSLRISNLKLRDCNNLTRITYLNRPVLIQN